MAVTGLVTVMLAKELHPEKTLSWKTATDTGIVMIAKDWQSWKASAPMAITDSGIVMLTKDSQPLKVDSPMAVPELGGGHHSGLYIDIYVYIYIYACVYVYILPALGSYDTTHAPREMDFLLRSARPTLMGKVTKKEHIKILNK